MTPVKDQIKRKLINCGKYDEPYLISRKLMKAQNMIYTSEIFDFILKGLSRDLANGCYTIKSGSMHILCRAIVKTINNL